MSIIRRSRLTVAGTAFVLSLAALTGCSAAAGDTAVTTPEPSPSTVVTTESTADSADSDGCTILMEAMKSVDGLDDPTALTTMMQSDPTAAVTMIQQLGTVLTGAAEKVAADSALAPLTVTAADSYVSYGELLDTAVNDPANVDSTAMLQSAQDSANAMMEIVKLCAAAQ